MTDFNRDDDIIELQKAALDGDQGAWRALVLHYSQMVWSVCRAFGLRYDDAQDVHQFVWLTLAQNLGRIDEPAALGGWLWIVARNECLRVIRLQARQVPTDIVPEPDVVDETGYADANVLLEERKAQLWREVDQLGGRCPALLRALMADPQPTYEEIASQFGIAIGSVGPIRGRCLKCLRARLR